MSWLNVPFLIVEYFLDRTIDLLYGRGQAQVGILLLALGMLRSLGCDWEVELARGSAGRLALGPAAS